MKLSNRLIYSGIIFALLLSAVAVPTGSVRAAGTINLTTIGTAYTQTFDTLANTGTTNNIDALNNGWYLSETGTNANGWYAASTGSDTTGDTYSYGAVGSPERALGGLQSGALTPFFGASFTNATGTTILSLTIAYTGEEWRLGTAGRADRLNFQYSTDATSLTTGTWTSVAALDFTTPDTATLGAKDGNAAGERTALSATIPSLSIANGATFWIRWTDSNVTGSDDGLAVDDFSVTPSGIPSLSINDVSAGEGESGTTTFAFTVSLSFPAPPGGVIFDIATANNTATIADGDYIANSLTGQTIPSGNSTMTFNVQVNGDSTAETDETFFVNVTNVTGATVGDGQGLGTINNDDTTTTLATSGSPSNFGASVVFTATVTELGAGTPTGTVEFREGAVVLGTGTLDAGGQAIFSTSTLTLGTHNITAYYLGDGVCNASNSTPVAQVIGPANTTTAVATSGSPSSIGAPVTFTATVTVVAPGAGTPTGTVQFFDGGISLGTGTLNAGGQATLTTSSLTTGSHTITATYSGSGNFNGSTSPGITQVIEGPPGVTLINSVTDTGDGQVAENEHTSAALTQLLVVFSKAMNADTPADLDDSLNVENYSLVQGGSTVIPINGVITYNAATHTATLDVNGGVVLPDGEYTLTVLGGIEDTLGVPIGTDFVRHFYVDSGYPHPTSIVTVQGNAAITNGATINVGFSRITITFNEDLSNAGGGAGIDDAANPLNYLVLQAGPNGAYDTGSCLAFATNGNLPLGDDTRIPTGAVTYTNNGGTGPFVATVPLNGGTDLSNGAYRLLICGTTSIVDLASNPLNNGADSRINFNVLVLNSTKRNPKTGFAPGVVTVLPEQPTNKAYTSPGNLWIEIPRLNLKTDITGVPLAEGGWDVTWLNRQVGWLEGTAYPTWEGNTILTAHSYTADGEAGPFALLKNLSYGENLIIHLGGMKYTYTVRTNLLITADDTRWLTKHEKLAWITLITCQQYDERTQSYRYRRVVRGVLVSVEPE